jgi:hypothetical protein
VLLTRHSKCEFMEVDPIIWPKILQVMLVESNRSNHLAEIRKPHPNLCFPRTVKKSVYQSVLELGRQKKKQSMKETSGDCYFCFYRINNATVVCTAY